MFSLALLLVIAFILLRPLQPRFNVVIYTAIVFLVPLITAATINQLTPLSLTAMQVISAATALPIIYLLDWHLRQNAQRITVSTRDKSRRQTTGIYQALFSAIIALLITSIILGAHALFAASVTFALYLLGILIVAFITIPKHPVEIPVTWQRVIADTSIDVSLNIVSNSSTAIQCQIGTVEAWVKVMPSKFLLHKGKSTLKLNCTPPLAGSSRPRLFISVIDSRGLIQINQISEPIELHVIPRAKYAEWIARKYLQQTGSGALAVSLPPQETMMLRRGIEYHDSRIYQPGDQLKDVDWKHTMKLSKLIISEFVDAGEQAAIIVVNLSVSDAEEADKLAFNLITAALTLAREHIPTALAAYNHERVVFTTAVGDSREILKRTLSLVKDISSVDFARQYLKAPDIAKLRRNITYLKEAKSEPALRLLDVLKFEHRALEESVQNNPATAALSLVTRQPPAPATIFLISQLNHDAEAVLVNAEKLSRRKFTTVPLQANG